MSDVYVVEQGWDYEGCEAIWAGADLEAALQFADAVVYADTVTVTRFAPDPRELWVRRDCRTPPTEMTYVHRVRSQGPQPRTPEWTTIDSITRPARDGGEQRE